MIKVIHTEDKLHSDIKLHEIAKFKQKNWPDSQINKFNEKIDEFLVANNKNQLFKTIKKLTHYDKF